MIAHKKQSGHKTIGALAAIAILIAGYYLLQHNKSDPRYIFIDGGAHIGESTQNFLNSNIYRRHPWEIIAFEANPSLIPRFPKKPNATVLNKAIWISEEGIEFYLAENTVSSSIIKDKKTGKLNKIPVKVESVDFGQWLKSNFTKNDFILVKLDIEGAEYDVLEKMLADGTMEYVDDLRIEFHKEKVGVSPEKDTALKKQIEALGIPVRGSLSDKQGDWFRR
jgi:FkbM family methyltransferase